MLPIALWPKALAPYLVPLVRGVGAAGLGLIIAAVMLLLMAPLIIAAQVHLARVLRSGLAGAPLTDERIRMRDQVPNIARSAPRSAIAIGLIAGMCVMAGSAIALVDAYFEGHLARTAAFGTPGFVFGLLLVAYFAWLVRLRVKHGAAG